MIKKQQEMQTETRKAMRGGTGSVSLTSLMDKNTMQHCRMFSTIQLKKGCSIGPHAHVEETEYYWILSGSGIVTEDDGEKTVEQGDLVITGGGASHSIRNEQDTPLEFLALIILD